MAKPEARSKNPNSAINRAYAIPWYSTSRSTFSSQPVIDQKEKWAILKIRLIFLF